MIDVRLRKNLEHTVMVLILSIQNNVSSNYRSFNGPHIRNIFIQNYSITFFLDNLINIIFIQMIKLIFDNN